MTQIPDSKIGAASPPQSHIADDNKGDGKSLPFSLALSLLVVGAVAMGISPVFVREAEIGPFASAFWRVCIALPILYVWFVHERKKAGRGLRIAFTMAGVYSGLAFAGDLTFWHLAILNTSIANATLMACLAPVWVLLLSGLLIGEKVDRMSFVGLIFCLLGAMLLVGQSWQFAPEHVLGDFYGFVTSIFFGLYFLAIKVGRRSVGSGELTLFSTTVTTLILLVVALLSGDGFLPETSKGYAALFALGAISHVGGQGLLAVALGALSAVFSSLVIFVEALAAAIFGWLFFGEALSKIQFVGGALILVGVWIARPKQKN